LTSEYADSVTKFIKIACYFSMAIEPSAILNFWNWKFVLFLLCWLCFCDTVQNMKQIGQYGPMAK